MTYVGALLSVIFMLQSLNKIHLLFALLLGYFLVFPLYAEHREGEIIVRYMNGTTDIDKNKTAVQFNLTFQKVFKLTNSVLYSVDANQHPGDLKKDLEKLDCVKYITYNKIYRKQSYDPLFEYQWYLENTGQWVNFTTGVEGVDIGWKEAMSRYVKQADTHVAVMDSGFAKDHKELLKRHLKTVLEIDGISGVDDDGNGYVDDAEGWDFIDGDNDPYDFKGHGTQVAGIISSNQDGVGVQGISPDAYIKPLRVLNRDGSGTSAALAEALEYIYNKPSFRIVNLSLGSAVNDPLVEETIRIIEKDDRVLIVCAAGNGGVDGRGDDNDQLPFYPASYDSNIIVSVSAIDRSGNLSLFSNYGSDSVDIAAPGENLKVITIKRELRGTLSADGISWRETFSWKDSIIKSWSRKLYGSTYWMESPRSYTYSSTIMPSYINLIGMKDPRLNLKVAYSLIRTDSMWLSLTDDFKEYKNFKPFPKNARSGVKDISIDISEYAGGSLWLEFTFFPKFTTSYFDIGPMEVSDVDTNWNGFPYYEYQNGTSFAAPIVSGVAALVMSHRPDLLASDVKDILLNSVTKSDSLSGKVKSGGMVRADKAMELANTYRKRSSVKFAPTYNQKLTSDLKVKVNDIYLTNQEMTAGLLDGQGDYFEGDSIILKAIPAIGFNFEAWEESGEIISTNETYTFISEFKDYTFKAKFIEDLSDPDNDEFPNYAEAIYGTDIGSPDSDNDLLNDYDEWRVSWYGSSLRLLEDDSETISLLEEIIGADSYNKGKQEGMSVGISEGKVLGRSEGEQIILNNLTAYNLFTSEQYEEALQSLDTNATPYTASWFYVPDQGWMWSQKETYPWFYDANSSNWMYFESGHEKPRFYNYATKEWMTVE